MIALTDHDTVAGLTAAAAALPQGLSLIPGMELSCRHEGHSIHLLCYLFDPQHPELAAQCAQIRRSRVERASQMVARLADLGTGVTWEQVTAIAGDGVVGRPHIARAMLANGVIETMQDAFTGDWIGSGGRAYVPRYALDPADAIGLVHAAGGVTVLAHPLVVTRGWTAPEEFIAGLAGAGLDGVEVAHPDHDEDERARLREVATRLNLAMTAGSDDHGEFTGDRIGCESTGADDLARLLASASGTPVITA